MAPTHPSLHSLRLLRVLHASSFVYSYNVLLLFTLRLVTRQSAPFTRTLFTVQYSSLVYEHRQQFESQCLENQLQEAQTQQPRPQSQVLEAGEQQAAAAAASGAPSPGRNWKPLELKRRISEHARLRRTSFSLVGTPNYIGLLSYLHCACVSARIVFARQRITRIPSNRITSFKRCISNSSDT